MVLNYADLQFDQFGNPETPELMLQTRAGDTIGIIPGVYDLKLNVKYSEPSEMTFTVPAKIDGEANPMYEQVTGHKLIHTETYGTYITMNPTISSDGIEDIKEVKAYSRERMLDDKRFYLPEGTYKFYNLTNPTDSNTIIGRILECAPGWSVGTIDVDVAAIYRTFSEYDDNLLSFMYNEAPEKYNCVFVFDSDLKRISVVDAGKEVSMLPIYLDFDNLISEIEVEELSDEMVTAIRPYGADGLSIREVNPTGTNWIYNLNHFIRNGDIPDDLGNKWNAWIDAVGDERDTYRGIVAAQYSAIAKKTSAMTKLVELNGELEILESKQNIQIGAGENLTIITGEITAKKAEINKQKEIVESLNSDIEAYIRSLTNIKNSLNFWSYPGFTDEDRTKLSDFLIEQDFTEDTFVATDVKLQSDGTTKGFSIDSSALLTILNSNINKVEVSIADASISKDIYSIQGGQVSIPLRVGGDADKPYVISGDIIRGTLDRSSEGSFVLSLYTGKISSTENDINEVWESSTITIHGKISGSISSDLKEQQDDVLKGTYLKFKCGSNSSMYMTTNVSQYQKYAVQMELLDYAERMLKELSHPTYEFSVNSANFIFAQEFEAFRKQLELGKGVYLNVGHDPNNQYFIHPYIIEFSIDFEDRDDFTLVFANRFKRHDTCNTLKDMVERGYSSGRTFDGGKFGYDHSVDNIPAVSEFMNSSLDAAKNAIIAASNQSVIINGSGIHISKGNDDSADAENHDQMRIINSMIALTDNDWQTSKLAIGRFRPNNGSSEYFGVNAEVIAGKLVTGNNLIIENRNDDNVIQFRVDNSGAWLRNASFVLDNDIGQVVLDPDNGIYAGKNVATIDESNGKIISANIKEKDDYGHDTYRDEVGFHLDMNGNAYFKGEVKATSGDIGGFIIENNYLHSSSGADGSYVALNGSMDNEYSQYAMWAGGSNPTTAPFSVTKLGKLKANGAEISGDAIFTGIVKGATFQTKQGTDMMSEINGVKAFQSQYINLRGTDISHGNSQFTISELGDLTIKGNITMGKGSSINWATVNETNISSSLAYSKADSALTKATTASDTAGVAKATAEEIANGTYKGTFINEKKIIAPVFYATESTGAGAAFAQFTGDSLTFYNGGLSKIQLEYGSGVTQAYTRLVLGNSNVAQVMKRHQGGHDQLWIGNNDETCGLLLDFNNKTYRLVGTKV